VWDLKLRPTFPLPASQLTQVPICPHLLEWRSLVKKRLHHPLCGRIHRGPFLPPLGIFQAEDLLRVLVVEPKNLLTETLRWGYKFNFIMEML
jgi:hypothetical protein